LIGVVSDLVNEVYTVAEQGLWLDGTDRTTSDEVAQFIRAVEITVARHGNRTIGCIRIQQLDINFPMCVRGIPRPHQLLCCRGLPLTAVQRLTTRAITTSRTAEFRAGRSSCKGLLDFAIQLIFRRP
jgi:hypothetical protein